MTADRWDRVQELFEAALELPAEQWPGYLADRSEDAALRAEVFSLLEAHQARGRLDSIADRLDAPHAPTSAVALTAALSDRYRVERELGRGGMATVYLAHDAKHHRNVALKVLRPTLAAIIGAERFPREIAITARLDHPHILTLIDSGEAGGFLYYVVPYVRGESLRDKLVRERQLPLDDAVRITQHVASALDYAHRQGVVHRDIKPENILLHEGEAVVADFGIALALEEAGAERLTHSGLSLGTPQYMSPEQGSGSGELDGRCDIYSLGCVLYEMLAGHAPFAGGTAQETLARHALDPVPAVRATRRAVPEAVERAITKALAKQPADRFATATQFAMALAAPVRSPPPGRRARLVSLGLGLAVLGGAFAVAARTFVGRPPAARSIAVVPFINLSAQPESSAYFSDGITEELINALGQVPGLRVSAASSAFALKGRGLSVRQIAETLRVTSVLEGTVRRAGSGVRITAELVNAADGYHLWSSSYDREIRSVRDVLAVQNEIAHAIVGALQIKLGGGDTTSLVRRSTDNAEAYDLYLRGRYFWVRRSGAEVKKAIEYFGRAIERDPSYALAHSGLADAYLVAANQRFIEPEVAFPRAKAAALKALALDSSLAEAHASLGRVFTNYEWDPAEAERAYRRAIALNPGYALAHTWYGRWVLSLEARFDEAIREVTIGLQLDPLAPAGHQNLAVVLLYARRYDEAIEESRRALEVVPDWPQAHFRLAEAYRAKGMPEEALAEYQTTLKLNPNHVESLAEIGALYALTGRGTDAMRILGLVRARSDPEDVGGLASLYLALGEKDSALTVLERAFDTRPATLRTLRVAPTWDPLRGEPRFRRLLEKLGFER
jgi:TolB-like protein/Tfp pilus assembly protein PilF